MTRQDMNRNEKKGTNERMNERMTKRKQERKKEAHEKKKRKQRQFGKIKASNDRNEMQCDGRELNCMILIEMMKIFI
jgi:hypothetical protein